MLEHGSRRNRITGEGLMTFEDLEPKNVTRKPVDLSTWNIEDLELYIENMKTEISRAEAMIAEKQSVSSAAESLFKR
jgi:uncharacterized small protein (DUF1192 family)